MQERLMRLLLLGMMVLGLSTLSFAQGFADAVVVESADGVALSDFGAFSQRYKLQPNIEMEAEDAPSAKNKSGYTGVLWFYKKFVSSQDGSFCPMVPSCSHYMAESMKVNGILGGYLLGLDRVTRCGENHNHGFEVRRIPGVGRKIIDQP